MAVYNRDEINYMVVKGYKEARRHERNNPTHLIFEHDLEKNLSLLAYELDKRIWKPQPCTCFIINAPTKREVFAPSFRDRIVSHVLYSLVAPIFERTFIDDSFSCRKGKGTLHGVERLEHHIRSESENYKKDVYALSMDIEGYFLNINKKILFDEICGILEKAKKKKEFKELDYDFIFYLIKTQLDNSPADNCIKVSPDKAWDDFPVRKSLFNSPKGVGLAIGDIMSQLYSNVYLNILDQYVKRELKAKHYCRYVDDFKIISKDAEYLKECEEKIRIFLKERLGLILHRKKTKITLCKENLMFLGACIRNGRKYVPKKTLARINSRMNEIKNMNPIEILPTVNSYFGYLSQFKAYKIKKKLYEKYIEPLGLFINRKNFDSICFIECNLRQRPQNMIDCRTA